MPETGQQKRSVLTDLNHLLTHRCCNKHSIVYSRELDNVIRRYKCSGSDSGDRVSGSHLSTKLMTAAIKKKQTKNIHWKN